MFYYAKTYETFYNTAVWAKHYLNEGLFLYAYSVAVVHRPDMTDVILPPIYEIYPYYFYNVEVIQKAYFYKQTHSTHHPVPEYDEHFGYTIYANYSGHYLNLHPEQSMSYYLEDVGINSFYYYYNLYYPFWMSSAEFGFSHVHRGEEYFFFYQQLLARFYLERLSNGFGEIPFLNWDVPVETSYYPSLEYPNGLEFPYRPPFVKLHEYFYNYGQHWTFTSSYGYGYSYILDWEKRISDVIDYGFVYSNPDSPDNKYYGYIWLYASHLLGYSFQPLDKYQVVPSALEHFETSLRDPMFYQLYKKLWMKFYRYIYQYSSYTAHDLIFPGVKVTHMEIDSLVTYHEYFYSDLSNAVFDSSEELLQDSFHVRVAQERLNHKPFTYKITVQSEHATKAVVKIFLAPLYDEYHRYINISENHMNMVLLDYFVYNLTTGENVITHSSYDSHLYGPDPISYHELYKQMKNAQTVKGGWDVNQYYYFFPDR
ncbi:hypothetical protein NQ314_000410 [Rhamnusium bicolor]|uniref:Uncharacterized protein n=1 Tax=Rhamnusium bicolor TaxID=1586634 RepID=A0AAV8ZXB7_9CUCU|nr:hypothetical protein NQ314_000410 [Rhamnusium bicolor]